MYRSLRNRAGKGGGVVLIDDGGEEEDMEGQGGDIVLPQGMDAAMLQQLLQQGGLQQMFQGMKM